MQLNAKSVRERWKKQRNAICSATADWAQWNWAWKDEGIDGWMEGGGGVRGEADK